MRQRRTLDRRTLLSGTVAAAGAATVAGCGQIFAEAEIKEPDPSHTRFVMTVWGGEPDREAYQARVDLAQEQFPEYEIVLQLIPDANYAQKVQTMISSDTGPDIMQVAEDINVYSSRAQLVPLDEMIAEAGIDMERTFGDVREGYVFEGSTYGIPDRSGAAILYYNRDLFDDKGIEYPTGDWDWETFLAAATELTEGKEQFGFGGASWWPLWFSLIEQNGGHVVDPDTGLPQINSEEAVDALQWAQDLFFAHEVAPSEVDLSNMGPDMGPDGAFEQGLIAMNSTGFWAIGSLAEGDLNWDVAPFFRGREQAVSAFGSALTIPRSARNSRGSFEIIQFLTGVEGQGPIASRGQDVPANIDVQTSDTFLDPEWMDEDVDLEVFPNSADMISSRQFIPEWNQMQNTITDATATFWLGQRNAREMADDLQERLEAFIGPSSS
ncbi:MAG TPA: sugar ABC transporter substrate-binding protein [Candidatus Brachybacterium merdavium]|uniref:Sugar ABC transporter substrate-binding protein n=1 Tax=Candidatus Brachybacterium merdavium TaxID=2838513 RepID=A0A9D2LGF5_9MICO|nr:sugar ABC transporter substrate-binding protein [Candidatus Brachybacterium merdavium]